MPTHTAVRSTVLNRRTAESYLGDAVVMWVDPARVTTYVNPNEIPYHRVRVWFKRLGMTSVSDWMHEHEPFIVSSQTFPPSHPLESSSKYRRVANFIENLDDYAKSDWYRDFSQAIQRYGQVKHKSITLSTEGDLRWFFEDYVMDLVHSMRRDGFIMSRGGEMPEVMIGADGQLHKGRFGRHRFFVAHLVGTSRFPFRIGGVHQHWAARREIGSGPSAKEALVAAVRGLAREYR